MEKPSHIQLVCPLCKMDDDITSNSCSRKHEQVILKGVPSFTDETHFDEHWERNVTREIPQAKVEAAKRFLSPLLDSLEERQDLNILDTGCGDGVHMKVLSDLGYVAADKQVGVDISLSAALIAKERTEDTWTVVHADIGALPYASNTFDVVFSYGVLAYTKAPEKTFQELTRVLRPNGLIGIWVYPKPKGIGGILFSWVRKLCQLTGEVGTSIIAAGIVPFLSLLPTSSNVHLGNASWSQCKEVVMVNIAPAQLEFPTEEEVIDWFRSNGIEIIDVNKYPSIAVWGRMSSS